MIRWKVLGVPALAIYEYDEEIRAKLYQLKGSKDIELAPIFFSSCALLFRLLYHGYSIVPVPSSKEHDEARGFNQVIEIFRGFKMPFIEAISKTKNVKQSDLDYDSRQKVGDSLKWNDRCQIEGRRILLVDDVFTTGASIKACLALVNNHNPRHVRILIMSKTPKKQLLP